MGWLRKALPLLFSVGLISWLISRISVDHLVRAAATLRWQLLVPMTAAMVVLVYLWDAYCLPVVFATANARLPYGRMLRVRGRSYLLSALNQGLGQASLAWHVARIERMPLVSALSRSIVLACHDGFVLCSVALAGTLLSGSPRAAHVRPFCVVILSALLAATFIVALLPLAWRRRWQQTRWGAWLDGWTWRRSVHLVLLRVGYFAILGSYVAVALRICALDVAPATALAAVPLVLMAGILPSASGLGTRETALYLLLPTGRPDVLLAMGLIWSTGMLVFRLGIGFASLWFDKCGDDTPVARLHGTGVLPAPPSGTGKRPLPPNAPADNSRFSEVPQ
jgi:hypothetical protein